MDYRFRVILILLVILALSFFTIYKYNQENRYLKNYLPYLLISETIDYFNLVDMDASEIDQPALRKKWSFHNIHHGSKGYKNTHQESLQCEGW